MRLYTGDDFNYPELIAGDEPGTATRCSAIFDAIAPAAAAALHALDAGDRDGLRRASSSRPCRSPRKLFEAPTFNYKTGIVFLAFLNGHQDHFRMVGGLESARSIVHLADLFVLADRAGPAARPGARRRAHAARARARGDRVIDPARLSLNLITVDHWSLAEAVARCAAAGIGWVAPWRHQLTPDAARACCRDAGLRVSSLCRGGFFTAPGADDDNRRAVEEAAALGAPVLVLVCGPPVDGDLRAARATIAAGIERLLPYARDARRPAGDRAAAPDDGRRALGDRHARRGARRSRARSTTRASASSSTPTTCSGTRGSRPSSPAPRGLDRRLPRVRLARARRRTCSPAAA